MRIAVLGANGGLGRCLVEQGLARGLSVTAIVRRPEALAAQHTRLTVKQGDITDSASLEAVLAGHDAVLVAVAPPLKFRQRSTLLSTGAVQLAAAMLKTGVNRLIWVTSAGVDPEYVRAKHFVYSHLFKPLFLAAVYEDFARSEQLIARTSLDWLVVRPSRLTDGPWTGRYRVEVDRTLANAKVISRADLADLMLNEACSPSHHRATLMQAY